MISHRNLFFLFPAEMAEMAEIYQWDLWEVIIFTTEETEMVASLTQILTISQKFLNTDKEICGISGICVRNSLDRLRRDI